MTWFLIAFCAAFYLTIGALVAYVSKDEVTGMAKWIVLPLIALFWPLVILGILISVLDLVNRGNRWR